MDLRIIPCIFGPGPGMHAGAGAQRHGSMQVFFIKYFTFY